MSPSGWRFIAEIVRNVHMYGRFVILYTFGAFIGVKCKAIPLQDWKSPEGSRSFRLPDFKTIDT
jgi:hypothetical protein